MSAAGSSSSRVATQRNKAVPETQGTHAASTDATHVVDEKKRRRKVAEPTIAQQSIMAPSTDLKSRAEPFDARSILPRVKHAKSLSRLLQASSSVERRDDGVLHLVPFECIDGLTRTYDRETEILKSEDSNHKRIDQEEVGVDVPSGRTMQGSQFVAFGVPAFPTKAKYDDICYDFVRRRRCHRQERCPRIHPVDIQLYLPGVIQESQRVKQMRRGDSGRQPKPLADSEPPPDTVHGENAPMLRTNAVNSDKPTPPSSSTPMPPTAIHPSIQLQQPTLSISADAQPPAQTKPTTSAVVTHPPNATPPSWTSAQVEPTIASTNQEPTVRVRLPPPPLTPAPTSPSVSVKLPCTRSDPPPGHRPVHPLPSKPSWLDDVQHWQSVSGLQDLPNSRYAKAPSEEGHSSIDSDEERVAICRRIASPDPFPLENWDPRADESAWSDSNVTDDSPQSRRVNAGREILASSAPRRSSSPTNLTLPSYASKPLAEMKKVFHSEQQVIRRPRPRTNERCRRWLRDMCDKGYDCRYIHDDLDYMDDSVVSGVHAPLKGAVLAHLTSQPERTFVRRPPETVVRVVHQHMHAKFGSGFQVTELDTGFESPWIFVSGFPDHLTDFKIETLLRRFGDVTEIRRPAQIVSPLNVKVHFSKVSEAFKAFTSLNGAVEYGRRLETRMAVENKKSGTFFKDTAVRIDWEGPNRNVYMGYADLEKAQYAVQLARKKPYGEYQPTAALHYALPAVGKVTVKFTGVPPDVTEKGMEIYGEHQGMVTERPNYTGSTIDETIACVKRLLTNFRSKIVDFEIRSAPYREGKMRVWAIFSSPKDAEAAAQHLHNRKPATMGYTRVMARHMKSISFSLSVTKACKVGAEIKAFTEKIWRQGHGYSLSTQDKGTFVSVRLCGEDLKVLGRLKAELERILNGEPVMEDGKVVWDDYFGRQHGFEFLMELERRFPGVTVERIYVRRSIRLFGVAEKRAEVRKKILEKVAERRRRNVHTIVLSGQLSDALSKHKDGFTAMEKAVGEGNVNLDLWESRLTVSGDVDTVTTVKDMLHDFRQNHNLLTEWDRSPDVCPACFTDASSPIKLPCGHTWCRTCLQRYLKVATEKRTAFPLKCHGIDKQCGEGIPLLTAREILAVSDFDALVEAAFAAHVQTHANEFHYCPTPDCSQIYRSTPEGISMQCPECLVQVCTACHTEAHDGLTCAESRDGDDLFREWASKHDIKQCPNCKMAIEKDEGCNHMVCAMCKTHVCWVCLQTFPNGTGIYGHMRAEHGSWGLGPIV